MEYKLERLESFNGPKGPLLLIIMDGVGIGKEYEGNAVYLAKPPNLTRITKECKERHLFTELKAHGPAVGLPTERDMGNSEVGHNAMGAGQIYSQGAKLVNESIEKGIIFNTDTWKGLIKRLKENDSCVHLIGLLSDGNVHSHINQLFKIIDGFEQAGIKKLRVHTLLDGRDVPENSALDYIRPLESKLRGIEDKHKSENYDYKIASGGGRMYVTMDRYESDWNVVKRGWYAHVRGYIEPEELKNGYKGYYKSAEEAILAARKAFPEKNDQTLPPFVIVDNEGHPVGPIKDGDVVINFNFRGDRAIQISKAFEQKDFDKFDRVVYPDVEYLGLLEYDTEEHIPKKFLVPPPHIKNVLTDFLCYQKISQYAIAETHKFGHVTYFWNGNRTGYICPELEEYEEIHSDPTEMIPKHPEMKADEVCDRLISKLKTGKFKFLRVNFANGDMVGHTGILEASIKAVKKVDECVGKLIKVVDDLDGITVVTADHGNVDEMLNKDGSPKTSHTLNPVGFWILDKNWKKEYEIDDTLKDPGLTNIASTIINLLGFKAPEIYRRSLIKFN
ncbi:MAG: 2,3-bisphosphoglycerate-independent phosphoglycerate mutase [Promethearchaeota archaeon]